MTLAMEPLQVADSPFRRWDTRWKLAALLCLIVAVAWLRTPFVASLALLISVGFGALARFPLRWWCMRLSAIGFALLPMLIILPLTAEKGGALALTLFARAMAVTNIGLIIIATAPLTVTLQAAQRIGLPSLMVHLTLLSYRYVFLLAEEFDRLRIALRVRGFRNRMNRHSYETIGKVTGTLMVRGHARSERVSQAMRCRGFDGAYRSLQPFATYWWDVIGLVVMLSVAVALIVADESWRGTP